MKGPILGYFLIWRGRDRERERDSGIVDGFLVLRGGEGFGIYLSFPRDKAIFCNILTYVPYLVQL